jgi:tetratricopeptide (TPR) repeat protein
MMPRVKAAALQALQLDPNLASAHVLLGDVHLLFDWDWPAAEMEYRRALEINPSLPEAQLGYATYLGTLGRFEEALSHVQQAYLFDPLAIDSRNDALWIYYFSGRMSETCSSVRKPLSWNPQLVFLTRCSPCPTPSWDNVPKRSGPQKTLFVLRTARL